ncbi:MAG: asparagine--tRNA ligase [Flavobacteriales bacterium]|nr:asparagine--tRNA ligase [Flavobacteriales bacterium]
MIKIETLLSENRTKKNIEIFGWVKTYRAKRFIAINDGSTLLNLQCVIDFENHENSIIKRINTGAALRIIGDLIYSKGKGQNLELEVNKIFILGDSDPDKYPIQPKKHSLEFLREKAHLRARTNTFNAIMKIRSVLAFGVHEFFQNKKFNYLNTPIITGSDAEGAGEMFKVTTLEPNTNSNKLVDYKKDFFGKKTHLTVSGQLEAESYALALGNVYTFGPTFRAENSNTKRHLAEFWMIEPEMAFYDLKDNMDLAEEFVKYLLNKILSNCQVELDFLNKRLDDEEKTKPLAQRGEMGLIEKINFVNKNSFMRLSYTEAIKILKNSKPNKKNKFQFKIDKWGVDLQSEHERFLVEKHFKCPLIIFDYPEEIKAFYMRLNEDKKTVGAMDVLFPGIGEIIGGSQREERLDILISRMKKLKIDQNQLWWYLELRKFGTAPHSGFGLGFERLVQFSTGMNNIRDVIPFPRTPQNASF